MDKGEWREVACEPILSNYQKFIRAIRTGKSGEPDFARGAEIQKVLDACFKSDSTHKPCKV